MNDDLITLAKIGRLYGIKGWLRINSYTDPPDNIFRFQRFIIGQGQGKRMLEMDQVKEQGKAIIGHFLGYDDPQLARQLVGQELKVAESELPVLEKGQFYWHQLVGLQVQNLQGELLGRVIKILETGANDVLVVKADENSIDQRERLIPYLKDTVIIAIALDKAQIIVDWNTDYLA